MDSLGRAKLVDLEYAKKLDDSDSVTETQVVGRLALFSICSRMKRNYRARRNTWP